ncbi:hypothetical protein, partial [Inquilinus sp.]|uniref:hypothetical protein n=1 Tax=Inquilinus sp. TaxID=1932117 RepID=UPI0037836717
MTKKIFGSLGDNPLERLNLGVLPTSLGIESYRNPAALSGITASLFGGIPQLHLQNTIEGAWQNLQSLTASGYAGGATMEIHNRLIASGAIGSQIAGIHGGINPHSLAGNVESRLFTDQFATAIKVNQWASSLAAMPSGELAGLYPNVPSLASVTEIHSAALAISTGAIAGPQLAAALGLSMSVGAAHESTRLKLSAFAAAGEIHGYGEATALAAYRGVFGEWRTHPDLPQRFWREPSLRQRMYEEAEVDSGLIEASPDAALEIVVQGGLVGGAQLDDGTVAIVTIGRISMSIRSSSTRVDAYQVLGAFEEELRRFIDGKLHEKVGLKWFKQRVNGKLGSKAKETREAALRRGEDQVTLINYLDLGDLKDIV